MPEHIVSTVVTAQHLGARAHLLWAYAPALAAAAQPGQFVMVRCREGEGHDPYLRRPLSIHRIDRAAGNIALLFAEVGRGTRWLAQRQPRDVLDTIGPLGNGFTLPGREARLLMVAGGMGIAPLMALAEAARAKGHSVTLLQGAATATRLYPADLLPAGLQMVAATEDGSAGVKGLVSHLVSNYVKNADAVYACGPVPMYHTLEALPELRGKPVQMSMEARMGCGLGACFGCTIETKAGPKRVCLDGPIFELGQLFGGGQLAQH